MTEPRETKAASMASTQEEQTPQSFEDKIIDVLRACRGSRKLVLLIVAVALLLDNMLLTSVGELTLDKIERDCRELILILANISHDYFSADNTCLPLPNASQG